MELKVKNDKIKRINAENSIVNHKKNWAHWFGKKNETENFEHVAAQNVT